MALVEDTSIKENLPQPSKQLSSTGVSSSSNDGDQHKHLQSTTPYPPASSQDFCRQSQSTTSLDQTVGSDCSSGVAAAMAENASRKRANGRSSSSSRRRKSKVPRVWESHGVQQWMPSQEWDPRDMLVCPDKHLSQRVKTGEDVSAEKVLKGMGSIGATLALYDKLGESAKNLVNQSIFKDLLSCIRDCSGQNRLVVRGLIERFWDTTNTFHLPWGEMTVTPLDFGVLTGLPFNGADLPVEEEFHDGALESMFGPVGATFTTSLVSLTTIFGALSNPATDLSLEQSARLFILYLLSATVFTDMGSRARLTYVTALSDLKSVGNYNWGAAAYATFILYLRAASRSNSVTPNVAGFWRVLEIWFYEYFPHWSPTLLKSDQVFPVMCRWGCSNRKKASIGDLESIRRCLNESTPEEVEWAPWRNVVRPVRVGAASTLTTCRVILEGPCGWVWYLGERVVRQSLGSPDFWVPQDPPSSMFSLKSLGDPQLTQYKHPTSATEFILLKENYEVFKARLMGPLILGDIPVHRPVRPVRPVLPGLRTRVTTVRGEEEIPMILVSDEEIEGWPLPEGCTGFNLEESKEVLRLCSSLRRTLVQMRKDFVSLLHYSHPETTLSRSPLHLPNGFRASGRQPLRPPL